MMGLKLVFMGGANWQFGGPDLQSRSRAVRGAFEKGYFMSVTTTWLDRVNRNADETWQICSHDRHRLGRPVRAWTGGSRRNICIFGNEKRLVSGDFGAVVVICSALLIFRGFISFNGVSWMRSAYGADGLQAF